MFTLTKNLIRIHLPHIYREIKYWKLRKHELLNYIVEMFKVFAQFKAVSIN